MKRRQLCSGVKNTNAFHGFFRQRGLRSLTTTSCVCVFTEREAILRRLVCLVAHVRDDEASRALITCRRNCLHLWGFYWGDLRLVKLVGMYDNDFLPGRYHLFSCKACHASWTRNKLTHEEALLSLHPPTPVPPSLVDLSELCGINHGPARRFPSSIPTDHTVVVAARPPASPQTETKDCLPYHREAAGVHDPPQRGAGEATPGRPGAPRPLPLHTRAVLYLWRNA